MIFFPTAQSCQNCRFATNIPSPNSVDRVVHAKRNTEQTWKNYSKGFFTTSELLSLNLALLVIFIWLSSLTIEGTNGRRLLANLISFWSPIQCFINASGQCEVDRGELESNWSSAQEEGRRGFFGLKFSLLDLDFLFVLHLIRFLHNARSWLVGSEKLGGNSIPLRCQS